MCKGKKDCGCGCAPKYGGYTRSMLTYANGGLKKLAFGTSDTEPDPPVTSGLPLFQYMPNQGQSDPLLNISANPLVSDSFSNIQSNLDQRFRTPATPVLQQSSYVPRSDEEIAAMEQRAAEREAMQNFEQSMSAERIDSSVPGESRQQGLERVEELVQQQIDQYGPSIKLSDFTNRKDIALLQAFLGSQGYDLNTADKEFANSKDFDKFQKKYEKLLLNWGEKLENQTFTVDKDIIYAIFADKLNQPLENIKSGQNVRINNKIGF